MKTVDEINFGLGYDAFFDGESRDSLSGYKLGSPAAQRWLAGYGAAELEARNWNPNPTGAELRAAIEKEVRNAA